MRIDPADLRTVVVFKESTTYTRGTDGSEGDNLSTILTTRCKVMTAQSGAGFGKEFNKGDKINTESDIKIVIRYRNSPSITNNMKMVILTRTFEIQHIDNVNFLNKWLLITGREVI